MASNDTEIGKNGEKMQIFRQMNPYNSKTIEDRHYIGRPL